MNNVSWPLLVRLARSIRHKFRGERCDLFWSRVRPAYRSLLRWWMGRRGVPVEIDGIGKILFPVSFVGETVDPLEIAMLKRLAGEVSSNTSFYDIGASIGLHSLVVGQFLGRDADIHAFEPDLPSCRRYWENTERLRERLRIRLSRCFVSNRSKLEPGAKLEELEIREQPAGEWGTTRHLSLADGAEKLRISEVCLDDYVRAGARPPTLIKCDIEGAEIRFLEGAEETLRRCRPTLFISLHPVLLPGLGGSTKQFYDLLSALEYGWEELNSEGEVHILARPVGASL